MVCWVTRDGEDGGGVAKGNELVFPAAVIDDHFHAVGAQGDIIC